MRKDKIRDVVYKFLDSLCENLEIEENEYEIKGEINNKILFLYNPIKKWFHFNVDTIRLLKYMFGITEGGIADYVRSYFTHKLKNPNISVSAFLPYI